MATPRIGTVIRNFTLRRVGKGNIFLGAADAELPNWNALTMELTGSGLAGKMETVIPGHFQGLTAKITLHTPDDEFCSFGDVDGDNFELRGIIQGKDPSTNQRYSKALRVVLGADGVKSANPGKLTPGEKSDSVIELVTPYVVYFLDGAETLLWDFYNYRYRVNGNDLLAADRSLLGLA
jgi:P2 family phage contractile tail tube protein